LAWDCWVWAWCGIGVPDTRLDEYDQLEWWDVARRLHPTMTWEQFQRDWDEFQRMKSRDWVAPVPTLPAEP